MKVLLATIFAYPPRGGLGKYIQELKTGLEQKGHEVHILAKNGDEYAITKGNRQYPIKASTKGAIPLLPLSWGSGSRMQKYAKDLHEEIIKFFNAVQSLDLRQYQVIHAQDIAAASVLRVYKLNRTPLVLTVHGCVTAEYYYNGYIKPNTPAWTVVSSFESQVIQQCDRTIVPSRWLLGVYKKCQISTGNMKIISNGIDVTAFRRQMRRKSEVATLRDKTIIICTGRLEKVKGQHLLLDALARLKKDRKDWVCWIVGKGSAERALRSQSRRLGLRGMVKFMGRRNDIPALLKQAHIFVIPSLQENYPYTLVEAQVAGKPVVASRAGGITEMVKDEKTGLLYPAGDSGKLYRQVKRLVRSKSLQRKLGHAAKVWGRRHFSLSTMMNKVMDVYGKALQSQSGRKDKR